MTDPLAALAHWGGVAGPPRPVTVRENAVFEVWLTDGTHAALRLHRPGYQSEAAIVAELGWCAGLAAHGFPAPSPVPACDGRFTVQAGDRTASVVRWCPGVPVGASGVPLGGSLDDRVRLFHDIGRLLARLHAETDALGLSPDLPRPRWDSDGFLGEAPLWGRFWENPTLSSAEAALLRAARDNATTGMSEFASTDPDFGLIHADVLRENLLRDGDALWLIDFDDSGWGYRIYDLATALSQSLTEPDLPRLTVALLDGYATLRAVPADAPERLRLFALLRLMASCGWIAQRAGPDDPRTRLYAERALRGARDYLG